MNPPEKLRPVVAKAAGLRAGGASWEVIAAQLKRRPDTVRRWPDDYPDFWRRAFAAAEHRQVADAGAEAVLVLRQLLRAKDEKVRRDVARTLTALRAGRLKRPRRPRPEKAPGDADRIAAYLEALDDAQVHALIAELSASPSPAGGPAPPRGGDVLPDQSG